MTKLSVNINKIAVVRNSRGGNLPDVVRAALDIERFGAEGITVHPRPDARHIRYDDVRDLKRALTTELNIEGNPIPGFIDLVLEVVPAQVTLVPDAHDAITSNAGWDTLANRAFLTDVTARFHAKGIRVSVFVDPVADRHERYNETLEHVAMLEQTGQAFVIRPPIPLEIGSMERDPAQLRRVYDTGRAVAEIQVDKIAAFVEQSRAAE